MSTYLIESVRRDQWGLTHEEFMAEGWDDVAPIEVPCDFCRKPAGKTCRTPSGEWSRTYHDARMTARRAYVLGMRKGRAAAKAEAIKAIEEILTP